MSLCMESGTSARSSVGDPIEELQAQEIADEQLKRACPLVHFTPIGPRAFPVQETTPEGVRVREEFRGGLAHVVAGPEPRSKLSSGVAN